ncbi:ABC-2 type transporter-domain-containing protein [Ochromonadaceae sp. CCMP2298]|nr:ABC-2 type transporter-domain-containing protein [Ochromonadaceae sp. CCMP2298]
MQVMTMFRRHTLLAFRDPMLYTGRTVTFLFCTVFFAIIYIKARERTQEQILERMFFVMWIFGVPSCLSVVAVYAYNIEFHAIKREVKNGMVSPLSYLLTNTLLTIPFMFIFGISALGVSAYGMLNYNVDRFGSVLLIFASYMFCFESYAQILSVTFENPLIGMLGYMGIWFNAFLFNGFYITLTSIIWPFQVFAYILPLGYGTQAMIYQEFIDTVFEGAVACDPSSSGCLSHSGDTGTEDGWKCSGSECWGRTGRQILESVHYLLFIVDADVNTAENVGIILALAVAAKIGYVLLMILRCNAITTITEDKK